jgi:hypothetical protein
MTPERFLFALGVDNDAMNIKWPDQDDNTNWTPGSTSTANSRRLREGTRIIGGRRAWQWHQRRVDRHRALSLPVHRQPVHLRFDA